MIHSSCTPSEHVVNIAKKANGILSQLNRTLICRNQEIIVSMFKTFIRPIIESAGTAWCPWERKDIDFLEKIQRRATRQIPGIGKLSYEERLNRCKLTTLECRRERGDMVEVFKIVHGITNLNAAMFFNFTNQRHDVATRSAINNNLVPEKCRLDIRKHFFANRVVHAWNALPVDVREAASVNNFKNLYDEWINTKADDSML